MRASAWDTDGTIVRIEFYDGDVKMADVTNLPYTFTWTNAGVGNHHSGQSPRQQPRRRPLGGCSDPVNPPPEGTGTGLQGDYYDNMDFTGTMLRRTDPVVNFDWGYGAPDPAMGAEPFPCAGRARSSRASRDLHVLHRQR